MGGLVGGRYMHIVCNIWPLERGKQRWRKYPARSLGVSCCVASFTIEEWRAIAMPPGAVAEGVEWLRLWGSDSTEERNISYPLGLTV